MDFTVTDVRPGAGNTVVIACASKSDQERAREELVKYEELLGVAVEIPVPKKPRLIVRGVPKETTEEEFLAELKAINKPPGPVKFVKKLESYRTNVRTAAFVVEVDCLTREQFLNRGKVLILWNSCSVTDHVHLVQCFNFCRYGHLAKDRRRGAPVCGYCTRSHTSDKCDISDDTPRKCVNCVNDS